MHSQLLPLEGSTLKTSVIICTRNRASDLAAMLVSLGKQTALPTEIVIVDSSDAPVLEDTRINQLWNSTHLPSTLVYKHTAPGLTFQRNQGIALATGELIYFFDDDVILSSRYMEEMNKAFGTDQAFGGGMGTIAPLGAYKQWVNIGRSLFFLQRNYAHGKFTWSGMPTHAYGTQGIKQVEVLGGCCMAFRSYVFKKHTFDEALRHYGYMEDCDFSYRVSRDWALFYNPCAILEHRQSPLSRDSIIENKAMFVANYTYLFFKNFYQKKPWKLLAYAWSMMGLFLEAALVVRNKSWIKGYLRGLGYAWRTRANIPYQKGPR